MSKAINIVLLMSLGFVAGCDLNVSNWDATVIAKAENPKNGEHNFTPQRAEVIADRCGVFRSSCVSVRLLDVTGFANDQGGRLFTYRGDPKTVSITWQDSGMLRVRCTSCDPKKIERQLTRVNFVSIKYDL